MELGEEQLDWSRYHTVRKLEAACWPRSYKQGTQASLVLPSGDRGRQMFPVCQARVTHSAVSPKSSQRHSRVIPVPSNAPPPHLIQQHHTRILNYRPRANSIVKGDRLHPQHMVQLLISPEKEAWAVLGREACLAIYRGQRGPRPEALSPLSAVA